MIHGYPPITMLPSHFTPGLSIDYTSSKLYWISIGNGTINRCNLDGSGFEVLESMRKELVNVTALAVMGELGDPGGAVCETQHMP